MSVKRLVLVALAALSLGLAGCDRIGLSKPAAPAKTAAAAAAPAPAVGTLEWAASGPWRLDPERDRWRHPVETLKFFGLAPNMTVAEVFPGRGWYTAVIAPYLAKNNGRLIAASFDPATAGDAQKQTLNDYRVRFVDHPETFGDVTMSVLSPRSAGFAPENSVDLVIIARNVHTLLGEGYAEKAFAEIYKALKPGGILGIEQHRARSTGLQDPQASSGYVQEAYVKLIAQEAGFEFVGSSEINANPRDDRDHPFGVWTLPPTLRSAPLGQDPDALSRHRGKRSHDAEIPQARRTYRRGAGRSDGGVGAFGGEEMRAHLWAGVVAVLCAALVTVASAQGRRDVAGRFDYYLLSLSWSPSYCADAGDRDPAQCGRDRRFAFVVHGLWPQNERGWPANCASTQGADVPPALKQSMLDIMPSPRLVEHEWDDHGVCTGLTPQAYFGLTRRVRDKVVIPPAFRALDRTLMTTGAEVETAFVNANPGLRRDMIAVQCDRTRLKEVRVCVTKAGAFRSCGADVRDRCGADRVAMPPVRAGR